MGTYINSLTCLGKQDKVLTGNRQQTVAVLLNPLGHVYFARYHHNSQTWLVEHRLFSANVRSLGQKAYRKVFGRAHVHADRQA